MKSIFNENCDITSVAIFLLELLCHIYNFPPIASHLSDLNKALYSISISRIWTKNLKLKVVIINSQETLEEDRFTCNFSLLILSMLFSLWEKQFSDCFTNSLILHCHWFYIVLFSKVTRKLYCNSSLGAAVPLVLDMVPGVCDCSYAAQCCRPNW